MLGVEDVADLAPPSGVECAGRELSLEGVDMSLCVPPVGEGHRVVHDMTLLEDAVLDVVFDLALMPAISSLAEGREVAVVTARSVQMWLRR